MAHPNYQLFKSRKIGNKKSTLVKNISTLYKLNFKCANTGFPMSNNCLNRIKGIKSLHFQDPIYLVIPLTVCHTILMMLVWRIRY